MDIINWSLIRNLDTTFSTHVGLRRYKRLNFRVTSAAEIFQNTIAETLAGINNCMIISDDILVYGTTQSEHDITLTRVFEKLHQNNLTLNKDKCEFNKDSIEFYGFVFGRQVISPDDKKILAIKNLPAPNSVKDVESLLGLTN